MAEDKISRRLDALEEESEEQVRDLLITAVTEQHTRIGDELVAVKREPIGYTEIEWSSPNRNGGRIGVRYALYDGDQPSNWDSKREALAADADHGIVRDPEVAGD